MSWSAVQYSKFEDERTRPVRDLLARVTKPSAANACDIGCGPGNSTEVLRSRFPAALITGLDSSSDMIESARKRLPDVRFEVADICAWARSEGAYDVVLANAVLQWVPDHAALLPALLRKLSPGGALAVQMPDNLGEPAHCLMREIAADGAWADRLASAPRDVDAAHGPEWYYATLRAAGAEVDIWRTTYHHPLQGAAAVVEWFKGSALRPFLAPLDAAEQAAFLARYQAAVVAAYPAQPDGIVLLPFPRLFFVATKPGRVGVST